MSREARLGGYTYKQVNVHGNQLLVITEKGQANRVYRRGEGEWVRVRGRMGSDGTTILFQTS